MTQEKNRKKKYEEAVTFIETNKRNPYKHNDKERGKYLNWLKHNRKLYAAGEIKEERVDKFKELLALCERYRRKNQWK